MYEVTQGYLDKATAVGRVYSLRVDVGRLSNGSYTDVASYTGGVGVLALKIVRGQTTGGFSLGGTVCASLNGTFANSIDIKVKDRLQVYVRFGSGTDVTTWRGLGWFYVDSVKRGMYSQSVVAYDAMLRLEKNYKSKLTYPAKTSDVLAEISSQTNINLSAGLTLINDAVIEDVPLKDKSQDGGQRYYTRREMLGYIGATNAGSGYIDVDFKINLSIPTEVSQGIAASSVISQSIDDTDFSIANIVWNKSGVSYSLNDEFTENTVELVNPLGYVSEELILHNLETKLVGLTYSSVKLKKQGTGIYQLGDLVNYTALDETVYKMLIMGIVYDFSNGFFSETLYSLAKSASQQEYAGSQVTSQKDYASSGAATGGTLTEYQYLTDASVKFNGTTYTIEKDAETGLISKISDSNGNEFEPDISAGITDVAAHNAVFWAVAMMSGFSSSTPLGTFAEFVMDGVDLSKRRWYNRLGSDYMELSTRVPNPDAMSTGSLLLTGYNQIAVYACDDPAAAYIIFKNVTPGYYKDKYGNTKDHWAPVLCRWGAASYFGVQSAIVYVDGGTVRATNKHGYAIGGVDDSITTNILDSNIVSDIWHIACLTRDSANNIKFYVDGTLIGTICTLNARDISEYHGYYVINVYASDNGTRALGWGANAYKYAAFCNVCHNDAQVREYSLRLLSKYAK